MGRGGGKGGGGRGGGGRSGGGGRNVRQAQPRPAEVAVQTLGGRLNPDGSVTLPRGAVEDIIGYSIQRRNTGSVASVSINGQRVSASSAGSIEISMRNVRVNDDTITVQRVGGQAYIGTLYREGIEKLAKRLGDNVSINWVG